MTIKTTTGKTYECTLKTWNGSGYDPDMLPDFAGADLDDYPRDEDGYTVMTPAQFDNFCEYWSAEAEAMRTGSQAHDDDYSDNQSDTYFFIAPVED